jgi:glycosyltransferase involved in cell wall biosynthesis
VKTILWVTHVYARHPGDMLGGFLHRLARELPPRGYRTVVLAPGASGLAERETRDGVEIRRFAYASPERQVLAYTGEMHRVALRRPRLAWKFFAAMRRAAYEAIAELQPHVVHAHWWVPTAWASAEAANEHRVPLVVSLHGTDVRLAGRVPGAALLARRVLSRAALTLPVSESLAAEVRRLHLTRGTVAVLPMPADADVFRPAAGARAPTFVIAARLTRQKRIDVAIRAIARVAAAHPAVTLLIAGDGPERRMLEALATRAGVADVVLFSGVLPPQELAGRLRTATAIVLPSEQEGYGLSLVEGALCECAPVGARSGGITDLIESEVDGLLFPPGDAAALATAIERLATDEALARRLGGKARERALLRTAPPIADRLAGAYASLGASRS